jgi:elongator complex protein 1
MYKETLKAKDLVTKSKLSQEQIDTKVNRVCDAFLAVFEQPQYRDAHLQNIITAHCSKVPPALETGLDMIGRLQGKYFWFGSSIHDANYDDSFQRSLD